MSERTWSMFGHASHGTWVTVGDERFLRLHGYEEAPVPVTVTEDPDGDYMGWIEFDDAGKPVEDPHFIQHHRIFDVQFPYGHKAEVERGRGEALRLAIEPLDGAS